MKLDISKAFGKLNWNFLFQILWKFGISDHWTGFMRECMCTSKGSILVNRDPTIQFLPTCGVRQGDLISPYLFILAEELLSRNLNKFMFSKEISPVFNSPPDLKICHLLFEDDILLFFKASPKSLKRVKDLLSRYQESAGQYFNLNKSKLFFGKCSARAQARATRIFGIHASPLPST